MTAEQKQRDLGLLQDGICRDKVLRARSMTIDERISEAFQLTDEVLGRMLDGAMSQLGTTDKKLGKKEVRRRLDRLEEVHDRGRYANQRPADL